jgi:hypothetical protein
MDNTHLIAHPILVIVSLEMVESPSVFWLSLCRYFSANILSALKQSMYINRMKKTKISGFFLKYFFHFFDLVYGKNMF